MSEQIMRCANCNEVIVWAQGYRYNPVTGVLADVRHLIRKRNDTHPSRCTHSIAADPVHVIADQREPEETP